MKSCIDVGKHMVLEASHPSPKSSASGAKPFDKCHHFAKCNEELVKRGIDPVDWSLL